jgi:dephospho-CoA kinase
MPADQKAARADYVIRTDGTVEETDAQVDQVVRALREVSATEQRPSP